MQNSATPQVLQPTALANENEMQVPIRQVRVRHHAVRRLVIPAGNDGRPNTLKPPPDSPPLGPPPTT